MKLFAPLMVLSVSVVFLATTAFQCGSAELTSAKLYRDQKQYDKAEASCLKEIAKNDKNEEAWYLLGQVRYEMAKYSGMNDAFTKVLAISDVHKLDIQKYRLSAWGKTVNEGVKYFNQGRDTASYYANALECFKTATVLEPDSVRNYQLVGMAFYAMNNNDSTIAYYEQALRRDPTYFQVANSLGRIRYTRGTQHEASNDMDGAVKEYAAAARAFEMASKAAPDSVEYLLNLIDSYDRARMPEEALATTRTAVAKDANNKTFRYAYGVFLLKRAEADAKAEKFAPADSEYSASADQFKEAVRIDPQYTDAIYNLGVANLNWGVMMKDQADKKSEAIKKANKGKEPPEDLSFKEKFKTALPFLVKSTELRPNDAALWTTLGRIYTILNMTDKSKDAFQKAETLAKEK